MTTYVCGICPKNDPAYGECKLEYANYNGDPDAPRFCPFTGEKCEGWEKVKE
jgi:hypothetical protein